MNIPLFHQVSHEAGRAPVILFGKAFRKDLPTDRPIIVKHEDYPLISAADIVAFENRVADLQEPMVSGCPADPHPYRLMRKGKDGYDEFLMDIPDPIRGSRQRYPAILTIKPALVYLPSGGDPGALAGLEQIKIHVLAAEKLLDQSVFLDSVMIDACRRQGNRI